ncbi:MAG: hypothetical protein HQK87_03965 [Nitrospinae bacterium]|nr:hypothetical protein [Nitrospinota bacterium]
MADKTLADWTHAVAGFAADGVEVVRLKLRIIGFSNKLTGLFARLGEAAFEATETGTPLVEQNQARRLMDDIREARREIKEAEEGIRGIRAARAAEEAVPSVATSSPTPPAADVDATVAGDADERKEG